VILLTKDCLKCETFLNALQFAVDQKKRIILIHDPSSGCSFPQTFDLPKFLAETNIFDSIAITFLEEYANECWKELVKKFSITTPHISEENVETDAFLSHKQLTGQVTAHPLYITLTDIHHKRVFLDVRTEFDLHDLKKLVEKTKLFVFIMTQGILESHYCFIEFETAQELFKPTLVIYGEKYEPPEELPIDSKWKKYEKILLGYKAIRYGAHFHDKAVEKILKKINKL